MKVALLGLGLMGLPIAQRLVHCGHDVVAWNRSQERLKIARDEGLSVASSLTAAVTAGEVLILTLSDAAAIEEVLFDPSVTPLIEGKTVLQMGTISPDESRNLGIRVEAAGGDYLETPVLGSIPEARAGELIIMAAGSETAYHQTLLLLRGLGKEVEHLGPVGKGAAVKLAMNQLIVSLTAGFSQSLGLIRAQGVEVEQFMQLLRQSALYAPTFDKKLKKFMEHDYSNPNFPLRHLIKDLALFQQVAESSGINGAIANATLKVLLSGQDAGYGDEDYSSLYEAINPGFDAETDIGC
ncbi:MAG: hydroxyacid dehydrogenase [gamma proteobacterium symbiont of Ctena orbiculata]|uniref:NAD(P)-dependent oxidoreductase n=1 Tax=Candidatus Thiodiazotropha taylori TaxID=2792791 RepID=A0A944M9J4_9GAMM|nr:NAD(P)-dependent oxidoreductase [Candidatus Thiodiazotropha taylori]PUB88788.1 MAG: hydroxyacid dehydrogenase [gamma proteobacterium symbiont of Ctena orbiculata]MBT2989590.1 NAD(P)-dependent oxidoreductase [Candidatus Thiodiazotropha taylori]MBT2997170.1 NAD(P)-dependent oxidoreductase [Candidatus Thiodiazotropha taylori]MBT3001323.1 NAD(P)-dependent oxidoreductase [Candidatus Thiodiazotropha taylori]